MVDTPRIERGSPRCERDVLPLNYRPNNENIILSRRILQRPPNFRITFATSPLPRLTPKEGRNAVPAKVCAVEIVVRFQPFSRNSLPLYWWTRGDSNPDINLAKVACYHYITGPSKWLWAVNLHQLTVCNSISLVPGLQSC